MKKRATSLYSAVSLDYALLDCYKRIGLKENDVVVILEINHLLEQGNSFINSDMLSLKMALSTKEIDAVMSDLVSRKFLSYDLKEGKMATSLEGLKAKVYDELQKTMDLEQSAIYNDEKADRLSGLYAFYEDKLERTLSPIEKQTIQNWVDIKYTDDEIKNALLDALRDNKRRIRAIEKILKASRISSDMEKEGHSAVSDTWDKDIEETAEEFKKLFGKK